MVLAVTTSTGARKTKTAAPATTNSTTLLSAANRDYRVTAVWIDLASKHWRQLKSGEQPQIVPVGFQRPFTPSEVVGHYSPARE